MLRTDSRESAMNERRLVWTRHAISAALLGITAGAFAQTPAAPPPANDAPMQARHPQMMQNRLDQLGRRLEIRASQQDAWQSYVGAVKNWAAPGAAPPAANADATAISRFRAERATARAQQLTQIADATAKLAQALDPKQRLVLDEVTRRAGRPHGMDGMHRGGGMHGHGQS